MSITKFSSMRLPGGFLLALVLALGSVLVPASPAAAFTQLTASPSHHDFGHLPVGAKSQTRGITFSNNGPTDLTVMSLSILGQDDDQFLATTNCGGTLFLNSTCTVVVQFAPTRVGQRAATVKLTTENPANEERFDLVDVSGTATNALPVGGIVLSVTEGRNYGLLAWAIDPDTGAPVRMRVTIPGVVSRELDWNYLWADMPAFTNWQNHEALVFLAQLPPGTHEVCFDGLDPHGAGWARLGCRTHTVK